MVYLSESTLISDTNNDALNKLLSVCFGSSVFIICFVVAVVYPYVVTMFYAFISIRCVLGLINLIINFQSDYSGFVKFLFFGLENTFDISTLLTVILYWSKFLFVITKKGTGLLKYIYCTLILLTWSLYAVLAYLVFNQDVIFVDYVHISVPEWIYILVITLISVMFLGFSSILCSRLLTIAEGKQLENRMIILRQVTTITISMSLCVLNLIIYLFYALDNIFFHFSLVIWLVFICFHLLPFSFNYISVLLMMWHKDSSLNPCRAIHSYQSSLTLDEQMNDLNSQLLISDSSKNNNSSSDNLPLLKESKSVINIDMVGASDLRYYRGNPIQFQKFKIPVGDDVKDSDRCGTDLLSQCIFDIYIFGGSYRATGKGICIYTYYQYVTESERGPRGEEWIEVGVTDTIEMCNINPGLHYNVAVTCELPMRPNQEEMKLTLTGKLQSMLTKKSESITSSIPPKKLLDVNFLFILKEVSDINVIQPKHMPIDTPEFITRYTLSMNELLKKPNYSCQLKKEMDLSSFPQLGVTLVRAQPAKHGRYTSAHFMYSLDKEASLFCISEYINESDYTFDIPRGYMELISPFRKHDLKECEKKIKKYQNYYDTNDLGLYKCTSAEGILSLDVYLHSIYKELKRVYHDISLHCSIIDTCHTTIATNQINNFTFKPSVYKAKPECSFLPTNLHEGYMYIYKRDPLMSLEQLCSMSPCSLHFFPSAGSPTSYVYGYINGGIYTDVAYKRKIENAIHNHEMEDVEGREEIYKSNIYIDNRLDICFSQALSIFISSFTQHMNYYISQPSFSSLLSYYYLYGYPILYQSLLSYSGKEEGMIEDLYISVYMLKMVRLRFHYIQGDNFCIPHQTGDTVDMCIENKYLYITLPLMAPANPIPAQYADRVITLCPFTISLGVDVNQRIADIKRKSHSTQAMNIQNILFIMQYLLRTRNHEEYHVEEDVGIENGHYIYTSIYEPTIEPKELEKNTIPKLPNDFLNIYNLLKMYITSSSYNEQPKVFIDTEDIMNQIYGSTITMCKSGKDRTGMLITLKQSIHLYSPTHLSSNNHGNANSNTISTSLPLPNNNYYSRGGDMTPFPTIELQGSSPTIFPYIQNRLREQFRAFGVRLENTRKNTGKARYMFNLLQLKYLPELLRAPRGTEGGGIS
ncbi:hypothetical protein WA158_000084 [Blastocystis sp. Blastoise]